MGCFLKRREGIPSCEQSGERAPHLGGGGVPGEDGPGLPVHAVAVMLVNVLSQPIHVGAGQPERQLQVLMGKQEGPDAGVQPGPRSKSESHPTTQWLSAREWSESWTLRHFVSRLTIDFHAFEDSLSRVSLIL